MPKKFVRAMQHANGEMHFRVLLDESKTLADGSPDPKWCRDYRYAGAYVIASADGKTSTMQQEPPGWKGGTLNGTAYTDWPSYCAAEAALLAQAELDALTAPDPTPLAMHGKSF